MVEHQGAGQRHQQVAIFDDLRRRHVQLRVPAERIEARRQGRQGSDPRDGGLGNGDGVADAADAARMQALELGVGNLGIDNRYPPRMARAQRLDGVQGDAVVIAMRGRRHDDGAAQPHGFAHGAVTPGIAAGQRIVRGRRGDQRRIVEMQVRVAGVRGQRQEGDCLVHSLWPRAALGRW
ncbi:hypothetical protein D9M69_517680 [compost metagenome]